MSTAAEAPPGDVESHQRQNCIGSAASQSEYEMGIRLRIHAGGWHTWWPQSCILHETSFSLVSVSLIASYIMCQSKRIQDIKAT